VDQAWPLKSLRECPRKGLVIGGKREGGRDWRLGKGAHSIFFQSGILQEGRRSAKNVQSKYKRRLSGGERPKLRDLLMFEPGRSLRKIVSYSNDLKWVIPLLTLGGRGKGQRAAKEKGGGR